MPVLISDRSSMRSNRSRRSVSERLFLTVCGVLLGFTTFAAAGGGIPHSEHPRPDFRRKDWRNLNGQWFFDFDLKNEGLAKRWYEPDAHQFEKTITVPFPWESKLSGIGNTKYKGVAWYAKRVKLPWAWQNADKDRQIWLHFGAVDFRASVWVNGKKVGEHVGGYTPFAMDITGAINSGAINSGAIKAGSGSDDSTSDDTLSGDDSVFVVVRAEDRTDPSQPVGKQVGWYTRTSGIWQTVWVEFKHATHVERFKIDTDIDESTVTFHFDVTHSKPGDKIKVTAGGVSEEADVRDNKATLTLKLDEPKLWSPEDPYLYDADVTLSRAMKALDRVRTYFGMRQIKVDKAPGREYTYIYLNKKPIYLRGALHQSFHPDGIYQYPTDEDIKADYQIAKDAGFNFLRIHIKIDDPRALYYADKVGILLMCDMPNFWLYGKESEGWYERMLREAIDRDYNHPSIIAWCDFNETWGIGDGGYGKGRWDFVARMFDRTRALDATRLVEDNSACNYDHVKTDINSWHFYINDYAKARDHISEVVKKTFPGSGFNFAGDFKQDEQPLINSEYGGISAGLGDQDVSWCLKFLTNELRKHPRICGYIYTELSDIEWEHNGIVNYDRTPKTFGYRDWFKGFTLKDINNPIFVVLDAPPGQTVRPGQTVEIPVLINYFAHLADEKYLIRWSLAFDDRFGQRSTVAEGQFEADCVAYDVTAQETIKVDMPSEPGVGALLVELVDDIGRRYAANYINFHVAAEKTHAVEVLDNRRVAIRFQPTDFSEWEWSGTESTPFDQIDRDKISGNGYGKIAYSLRLPPGFSYDDLIKIELLAEVAAKAGGKNLDWPQRTRPSDYPQTDTRKFPTDLEVLVNGKEIISKRLEDDPADARGVLSHMYKVDPGSFGYLVKGQISPRSLFATGGAVHTINIVFQVPPTAEHKGGLTIFGDTTGRYAFDPTVILEFRSSHELTPGTGLDPAVVAKRMLGGQKSILPTAKEGKHTWRYTFEDPPTSWVLADFDDSGWKTGPAGFGTKGTPNAVIGTEWKSSDIWLRTVVKIEDPDAVLFAILRYYHDDAIEIYINGQRILERDGYVTDYVHHELSAEQRTFLKDGDNLIAVHCRQESGRQNVDVGLSVVFKDRGSTRP